MTSVWVRVSGSRCLPRAWTCSYALALLAACASGTMRASRGGQDFRPATVSFITRTDGSVQFQLRLGSADCRHRWGMVAVDTPAAAILDAGTQAIVLNQPIEVTHGVNGEVRYDYRDSGEYARSARVTFTRSDGSKAWGEYRTVGPSGVVWEGAFVATRCG